jgi:hypothetical protein
MALDFLTPLPACVSPFDRRISAFINIKVPIERDERVSLLARHTEPLPYNPQPPSDLKILVPIEDSHIIAGLRQALFPHPFTLIGLLTTSDQPDDVRSQPVRDAPPSQPPSADLKAKLLPFHLVFPKTATLGPLIPQLAGLYFQPTDRFLLRFKNRINADYITSSWKAVFHRPGLIAPPVQEQIDHQVEIGLEGSIMRFPSVNWSLTSMDDLFALHVLACAMDTTMYLIMDTSAPKGTQRALDAATLFTLPIGPQSSRYSLFIVVQSAREFCIAAPQCKVKALNKPPKEEAPQKNLLQTFETIDSHMAVFYRYPVDEVTDEKEDIDFRVSAVEKSDLSEPALTLPDEFEANVCQIEAGFLSFNRDVNGLLMAFFETITDGDAPITIAPAPVASDASPAALMVRHVRAVVEGPDRHYLLTRVPKGDPISLVGPFAGEVPAVVRQTVRSESRLHLLCRRISRRFVYTDGHGDFSPVDGIRVAWKHRPARSAFSVALEAAAKTDEGEEADRKERVCPCEFDFEVPESCIPLFLPHASRWSLADARTCAYTEFLCQWSILSAALDATRKCDFCQKRFDKAKSEDRVLTPVKVSDAADGKGSDSASLYVRMICLDCLLSTKYREKSYSHVRLAFTNIPKRFPLFKMNVRGSGPTQTLSPPKSAERRAALTPVLAALEANINYIRRHPIGSLREMIPMIDRAFRTLQRVVRTYQRMRREASDSCPPFSAVLGIRDDTEAQIQLNGWKQGKDASKRPIDAELFGQYLDLQRDVQFASPPYRLIHGAEPALVDLNDAFAMRLIGQQYVAPAAQTVGIRGELSPVLSLTFTFPGHCVTNKVFRPLQVFSYKLYPIASESHLGLSPIVTISTHLSIDAVWVLPSKHLLIAAHAPASEKKDRYRKRAFYLTPMGNVALACLAPVWTTPVGIKEWRTAALRPEGLDQVMLAFSYETVNDMKMATLRINVKTGKVFTTLQAHRTTSLAWTADGELVFVDDTGAFTRLADPEPSPDPEPTNEDAENEAENEVEAEAPSDAADEAEGDEVDDDEWEAVAPESEDLPLRLVSLPSDLIAITQRGAIWKVRDDTFYDSKRHDRLCASIPPDVPLFAHPSGLLAFPSPSIPFDNDQEDRVSVAVHKFADVAPFEARLAVGQTRRALAHNQAGLPLGEAPDQYPRALWNFHLAAAEFIPALVAYADAGRMWVVTRDCDHFRALHRNSCFSAAVAAFYARNVAAISLHHIEDVIMRHGLRVNIIGFVPQMDDDRVAQYADAVVGTRLCFALIPGFWAALRVIGDVAHVVLFVRGMADKAKLQLVSLYRAANVINICSAKVVGSLNWVSEWLQDFRTRNTLVPSRLVANWNINAFLPRERNSFNAEAIELYKRHLDTKVGIIEVPFIEDWNHPNFAELQEEFGEVEDSPWAQFSGYWNEILSGEPTEGSRNPFEPEEGVRLIKQIAATYLTLCEFQDLPSQTVLKLCNLEIHNQ